MYAYGYAMYRSTGQHVLINERGRGILVKHYTDTPIADEEKRVCDTSGAF